MAAAKDISVGMEVRTPVGKRLGQVAGVEGEFARVARGALRRKEFLIPLAEARLDGDVLLVSSEVAEEHLPGRRLAGLRERPRLELNGKYTRGDPRLSGSDAGTMSVEREEAVYSTSSDRPHVVLRESVIGVGGDDGTVQAWVSESELLYQSLGTERSQVVSEADEDEAGAEDEGAHPGFEDAQAEHP